jgi:hypothetical protein
VTSDVADFGPLSSADHAGIIPLHDDTMPGYRIASALLTLIDAYPNRDAFTGRETLDVWV